MAVDKDGFVVALAGALEGEEDFDPLVGQGAEGLVMGVPGEPLAVVELLGPVAGEARAFRE